MSSLLEAKRAAKNLTMTSRLRRNLKRSTLLTRRIEAISFSKWRRKQEQLRSLTSQEAATLTLLSTRVSKTTTMLTGPRLERVLIYLRSQMSKCTTAVTNPRASKSLN